MKVGTILVATDTNPLYCDFIPNFITTWKKLIPEADICIVMIADEIPSRFRAFARYIHLIPPIPGIHTAFHAQCIRLLYPRHIVRNEGVLITDMDMLPMNRSYYVDSIANLSSDAFVVYRDVCLPKEISMCYNIAHPHTWRGVFGTESIETVLRGWYVNANYSGEHGGSGWGTDQQILVTKFNEWNGTKVILNDVITRFARLDRVGDPRIFRNRQTLRSWIGQNAFADYHCLRPYLEYKDINDFIVSCVNTY
jgi:hypothetical protein